MKYYFDPDLGVRAFEDDGSQDFLITPEMRPMSSDEVADYIEQANSNPVPSVVTMRQARLALLGAGLLDDVEAAINALPEPPRTAVRIEWDYSSEVFRDKPFVLQLGTALGLDSDAMDQLFITAATL